MEKKEAAKPKDPVKLPTVGYTGHRPGNDAQNFYGKNFRECSLHSKWIQKNSK